MKLKSVVLIFLTLFFTSCMPPGTGGGEGSAGVSMGAILPFVLIFILFYFLIIRPQSKQNRERKAMLKDLKRGDRVLTTGGIYGRIINLAENELTVEIAKGINIQMVRSGVSLVENAEKESAKPKGGK